MHCACQHSPIYNIHIILASKTNPIYNVLCSKIILCRKSHFRWAFAIAVANDLCILTMFKLLLFPPVHPIYTILIARFAQWNTLCNCITIEHTLNETWCIRWCTVVDCIYFSYSNLIKNNAHCFSSSNRSISSYFYRIKLRKFKTYVQKNAFNVHWIDFEKSKVLSLRIENQLLMKIVFNSIVKWYMRKIMWQFQTSQSVVQCVLCMTKWQPSLL